MTQQNELNQSLDPATAPIKRKRGRPRKEDVAATEYGGSTQRRKRNQQPDVGPGLVGQPVSGFLDGVFDAGFLLTVKVGNNGPLLKGMVFDSRLSIPITAANDVAPNIKMSKRDEIPIPVPISAEPIQRRGPTVSSPMENKVVVNYDTQGSVLRSKGSEAVTSTTRTVSKEAAPETAQVPKNQKQELTGERNLTSTNMASEVNDAGEPNLKLDYTSKTSVGNKTAAEPNLSLGTEGAGEPKLETTYQTTPANEIVSEPNLSSTRHTTPDSQTLRELKSDSTAQTLVNETRNEPKLDSIGQTTLVNENQSELKLDFIGQTIPVNETVGEPKLDSSSQISPEPLSEPGSEKVEAQNGSDQVQCFSSTSSNRGFDIAGS